MANDLEKLIRDVSTIKKQLVGLATTNQLNHASLDNSRIVAYDNDGQERLHIGVQDDGTHTITHVQGPPPPVPTLPVVTSDLSMITVRWDGGFEGGRPADWDRVEIHVSQTEGFTPAPGTLRGSIVSQDGGDITLRVTGGTWYICLVAVSRAETQSEPSDHATITVEGITDKINAEIEAAEKRVEEARKTLEAALAENSSNLEQARKDMAAALADLMTLKDVTLPGLVADVDAAEGRLSAAEGQISEATEGLAKVPDQISQAREDAVSAARSETTRQVSAAQQELEGQAAAAQARADEAIAAADRAARAGSNLAPWGDFENLAPVNRRPPIKDVGGEARSGTKAFHAIISSSSSSVLTVSTKHLPRVPVEPGRWYRAAFWMKATRNLTAAAGSAAMWQCQGTDTLLNHSTWWGPRTAAERGALEPGVWKRIEWEFTPPVADSEGRRVIAMAPRFFVWGVDTEHPDFGAELWIDDFSVVDVTVAKEALDAAAKAQAAAGSALEVAESAVASANGRNQNYFSVSAPSGTGTTVGDVWYRYTSDWSGVIGMWRWDGQNWRTYALEHQVVGSVDAGTISTGFLDVANRVRAGSILAEKLFIGSDRNAIPNGDLAQDSTVGWPATAVRQTTDKPDGLPAAITFPAGHGSFINGFPLLQVQPGDEVVFQCWVKADKPNSRIFIEVRDQNGAHAARTGYLWSPLYGSTAVYVVGSYVVPTEWTLIETSLKIAPGITGIRIDRIYLNHWAGTERNASVSLAGVRLAVKTGGIFIGNGSVQTPHLAADVMEVGNLKAGTTAMDVAVARKLAAETAQFINLDVKNLVATGESKLNTVAAQRIAADTASFLKLNVGNLIADTTTMNTAVINKLFSDVVVARMAQAQEFIGENAILTGAITAPKITASEELTAKVAEFLKVQAGQIEADAIDGMTITGATVQTSQTHPKTMLNTTGLHITDPDGADIVNLTARPEETNGNYLGILSPDGSTLANISDQGIISGAGLSVETDPEFQGLPLLGDVSYIAPTAREVPQSWFESIPRGIVAYGRNKSIAGRTIKAGGGEVALMELQAYLLKNRAYKITVNHISVKSTWKNWIDMRIRYTWDGSRPTLDSNQLRRFSFDNRAETNNDARIPVGGSWLYTPGSDEDTRFLVTIRSGAWAQVDINDLNGAEMIIEDIGPAVENTSTNRTDNNSESASSPPPPPPEVKNYTKVYTATSGRTYWTSGGYRSDNTQYAYQGKGPYGSSQRSAIFFPSMTGDLSGATITGVRVYLYFSHWYYSSGGTAKIHLHGNTSAGGSLPGTFDLAKTVTGWQKPGGKWVDIPSTFWAGIKSGKYRGIGLGDSTGNLTEYGYAKVTSSKIEVKFKK